ATRNARRRAKKEELKREAAEKKRDAGAMPEAVGASRGGVSFEELMRDDPKISADFRAIKRDNVAAGPVIDVKPAGTAFQDLLSEPPSAAPARVREEGVDGSAAADAEVKAAGLQGPAKEGSSRLTLGPIDDNRPILTASGYQPPTKRA